MTRYCIMSHNRSLPADLERFEAMIRKNSDLSDNDLWATDADWLLALSEGHYDTIWWTAPEDFEPGGILLVHLRALADGSMSPELLEKAMERMEGEGDPIVQNLFHAERLAACYGDTIFAAARVGGIAEQVETGLDRGTHSVVLNGAHVFESPLTLSELADVVEVGGGLFTGLKQGEFEEIRDRLSENNHLPDFVEMA